MTAIVLILGMSLFGLGFIFLQPKWHQILFRRRYFCSRCSEFISKEEALDEARYEDRP